MRTRMAPNMRVRQYAMPRVPSWAVRSIADQSVVPNGMPDISMRIFLQRPAAGQQHTDLAAIAPVLVAELRDHVPLLEPDADEDVARRADREQQMAGAHHGRRPEAEQETKVKRMADVAIERRRPELRCGQGAA